jgi:UDP-glucose 4-epimerase
MSKVLHALVTGATGVIGPWLVRSLQEAGHSVRVLSRKGSADANFPPQVQVIRGGLSDSAALKEALSGISTVFHLAAKLHLPYPSASDVQEFRSTNVDGTRNLVQEGMDSGVERLVYFSTISVYGPSRRDSVLDERSPLQPGSVYAETKLEAEQLMLKSGRSVILRSSAVYGPGMRGNYTKLCSLLKRMPIGIGDGSNRRTLVYVSDLCAAALLAAVHSSALGQVFNVTDGGVHSLRDIAGAIRQALGKGPDILWIPAGPVGCLASILDRGLRCIRGRTSNFGPMVGKILEDVAVSGNRIQQDLGFRPSVGLTEGWKRALAADV